MNGHECEAKAGARELWTGFCPHVMLQYPKRKSDCLECIATALQAAVQDVERQRDEFQQACINEGHRAQREWDRAQALAKENEVLGGILRSQTDEIVRLQKVTQNLATARDETAKCGLDNLRLIAQRDALAAALKAVQSCIRTTHVDMAGSTRNHYVLDSRRYAELTPEIRQLSPGKEAAP